MQSLLATLLVFRLPLFTIYHIHFHPVVIEKVSIKCLDHCQSAQDDPPGRRPQIHRFSSYAATWSTTTKIFIDYSKHSES